MLSANDKRLLWQIVIHNRPLVKIGKGLCQQAIHQIRQILRGERQPLPLEAIHGAVRRLTVKVVPYQGQPKSFQP